MDAVVDFLTLNDSRFEYVWLGPPPTAVPTLVFLHEGLGSAQHWQEFPADVVAATGCGALVYSRLGYGLSDPCSLPRPASYLHQEAQLLPQILAAFAIRDCILIGHSDGGSIALIYAGSETAVPPRGVITAAAHVFNEQVCVDAIRAARDPYLHDDLREKLAKYHQHVDVAFWGWHDVWLSPEFWQFNIEPYLPRIKVPLLAMQGEDDSYGTVAQIETIMAQAGGPTQMAMIPDCGHAPHKDQPEMTLALMCAFINRLLSI